MRPDLSTRAMAAGTVLSAGADWVMVGTRATGGPAQFALILLTVLQLLVAGLVGTRPSERIIRGAACASLIMALCWVIGHGLAPAGTALGGTDILAFAAHLTTAACGWLVLSRASITAAMRSPQPQTNPVETGLPG